MGVRQRRQRVDIRDVAVGVAQRLDIDGPGVWLDGRLDLLQIMDIHKSRRDAKAGKRMRQKVVAAAVDGLLGDNVPAVLRQGLNRIRDGRGARGQRQRGHAPFQRGDPLFQNILGGVGQPAVDVARVRQVKPGGGVRAVVEDVGGGGVDGHGPGVCGGVRRLLANVQLQGFEFVFTHGYRFLSVWVWGSQGQGLWVNMGLRPIPLYWAMAWCENAKVEGQGPLLIMGFRPIPPLLSY